MKKILLIAVAAFVSVSAFAQGTVNFSNLGRPIMTADGSTGAGAAVPAGNAFMAALFYAPPGTTDMNAFMQVGAAANFIAAGTIVGGTRTAPVTPAGAAAAFQIRVWEVATGADYDSATHRGASNIVEGNTGNPEAIPPGTPLNLVAAGLTGFQMEILPEPSVIALGALGAGALLLLRRRK
jgi:hypothetical protein